MYYDIKGTCMYVCTKPGCYSWCETAGKYSLLGFDSPDGPHLYILVKRAGGEELIGILKRFSFVFGVLSQS
jgi:hypothetical protein